MALWGGRVLLAAVAEDNTSGDRTVLAVAAGKRVRIFRCSFICDVTSAVDTLIQVGSTVLHRTSNALAGSEYGFDILPHYYLGADGEDVIINQVDTVNSQMNLSYELENA